jgi:hypothetical protein
MRPRDRELASHLYLELAEFERQRRLPGIAEPAAREVLVEQLLESVHRVEYAKRLGNRPIAPFRAEPNDDRFDPLKAAILHKNQGNIDEACWLVFLSVHFGKHSKGGWRYLREVYGRLGIGSRWDWASASSSPDDLRGWLKEHESHIRRPGAPGGFGNHRKYQSLRADSTTGTGGVIASYVAWIGPAGGHYRLFSATLANCKGDRRLTFDELYRSMQANVIGFGRLARFDYLAMLGKLGLAPIEPGSTYLSGATGPLKGARMLFGGQPSAAAMDKLLSHLDRRLQVGMQVLEDALCNWQKSPTEMRRFRG